MHFFGIIRKRNEAYDRLTILGVMLFMVFVLAGCLQNLPGEPPVQNDTPPGSTGVVQPPTLTLPAQPSPVSPTNTALPTGAAPPPGRLTILPGNAENLQVVGQVSEDGARDFTWLLDGRDLALATEEDVVLYQLLPLRETGSLAASTPALLTASTDRRLMAWVNDENRIQVWDPTAAQVIHTLQSQDGAITGLAFSPNGSILAAATYQNRLVFWDTSNGQQVSSQEVANWLSNPSYSPDGSLIAGADLPNFAVHIFDAVTMEEQRTLTWTESASPALYGAFFSPDWQTLAWVARGTVQLMDVASETLGPTLSHEDFVNDAAWSPDGSLISTAAAGTVNGSFSPVVFVWDAQTGELIKPLVQPEVVLSIAFSPDGRELASLIAGGNLQLWAVTR